MKKLLTILFFVVIIMAYCPAAYSDSGSKLFYNDVIYKLVYPVVVSDDSGFISAEDFMIVTGTKYEVFGKAILIYDGKDIKTYDSKKYTYEDGDEVRNIPVYIDGKLYYSFNFIEDQFNLTARYSKNSGALYLLPKSSGNIFDQTSFTNITYDYIIQTQKPLKYILSGDNGDFNDATITLSDPDGLFTAVISCDRLDAISLDVMRSYLNDYTSTDVELFSKIVEYKESYFRATMENFKRDFIYSGKDDDYSEPNMKIFGEYSESIFGYPARSVLFNMLYANKMFLDEVIHLNISIPLTDLKTIYSISFTVKKGALDEAIVNKMEEFVKSIKIGKDMELKQSFKIFKDKTALGNANSGIYKSLENADLSYTSLVNRDLRFKLSLPASFIQYRQNNLIRQYYYNSYKIDYNNIFSITAEPVQREDAIKNKVEFLRKYNDSGIEIKREGQLNIEGKDMYYLQYKETDKKGTIYTEEYYIEYNNMLLELKLTSRFSMPSSAVQNTFYKIAASLEFVELIQPSDLSSIVFVKYTNREEGYSFSYPENWTISNKDATDINYDSFSILSSDFSGPVEISIEEGELYNIQAPEVIVKYASESDTAKEGNIFARYSAPYNSRVSVLLTSDYFEKDGNIYIYRLINYLDKSDRNKLCYALDIVRGRKIYSIFISVSDYYASNGKIASKTLDYTINRILSSLTPENTSEYQERITTGEQRNRKLVFIEKYFQSLFGSSARVLSAAYSNAPNEIIVALSSNSTGCFYRLSLDFDAQDIKLIKSISKDAIMNEAEQSLIRLFNGKMFLNLEQDIQTMTFDVNYVEYGNNVKRLYEVSYGLKGSLPGYTVARKDHSQAVLNEIKDYLCKYFSVTDIELHFSNMEEILKINNYQETGKKLYTCVYAETAGHRGYFAIEIDPLLDEYTILSYTSADLVFERINGMYATNRQNIIKYFIDAKNKFEIIVFLYSDKSDKLIFESFEATLDSQTHKLEFKKKP